MRYILVLLVGALFGGALVFFLLAGAPKARPLPGAPVKAPEPGGPPPGTAVLTLDEAFFNTVLDAIFRDLGAPAFRLARNRSGAPEGDQAFSFVKAQGGCQDSIVLAQEGSGVKSGVRFAEGRVAVPLAFSGSYNLFGNCASFKGWAQTTLNLRFVPEQQRLDGEIKVEGVNLEGVSPVLGSFITPLVQSAINQRVNPIEMLRASQLALSVPVQASGGALRAQVKDVRAEVVDSTLRLYITYDFSGVKQ